MKRGKPLARKTPLLRSALKYRRASTGPTQDVVDAVYDRAGHSCEACGAGLGPRRGVDHHLHHRRPRAAGGSKRSDTNLPSNLLLLCPSCHDDIESYRGSARVNGHLLTQLDSPAASAVLIHRGRWVYLTDSGRYSTHPPRSTDE